MKITKIALMLAFLISATNVFYAQAPGTGFTPDGVFNHSDIDSFNMKNGNAVIHIPLFSLPQRGSRKSLEFYLIANTNAWTTGQNSCGVSNCTYSVEVPVTDSYQVKWGMQIEAGQRFWYDKTYITYPAEAGNTRQSAQYAVGDSSGATHPLYYNQNDLTQLRTVDGSRYLLQFATGARPFDVMRGDSPISLLDGNGINSLGGDQDGNSISGFGMLSLWDYSGDPIVDTVNRQISPPAPSESISSLCPNLGDRNQPVVASATWSVPGPTTSVTTNGMATYIVCYATVNIHTNIWGNNGKMITMTDVGGSGGDEGQGDTGLTDYFLEAQLSPEVIQSIVLPDNTYWGFLYESAPAGNSAAIATGNITTIIRPTGGSISYTYNYLPQLTSLIVNPTLPYVGTRTVTSARFPGDSQAVVSSSSYNIAYVGTSLVTTNTDPGGNDTVYTFGTPPFDQNQDVSRDYYVGPKSNNNVIKHLSHTYSSAFGPVPNDYPGTPVPGYTNQTSETTTLDGSVVGTTTAGFDQSFSGVMPGCIVTSPYSIPPSPSNCDEATAAPVSLSLGAPLNIGTQDGSGNPLQLTTMNWLWMTNSTYAQANLLNLPSSTIVNDSTSSMETDYTYDESSHGITPNSLGHLTTTTRLNNQGANVSTHTWWNQYGMVEHTVDGRGTTNATYVYDSTYNLFPVSISGPLGTEYYTPDLNTGATTSHTDLNNQVFHFAYDEMNRLWSVQNPDVTGGSGQSQVFCYPDGNTAWRYQAQGTALTRPTSSSQCPSSSGAVAEGVFVDGLGRTRQTQKLDPQGTVYVDTVYNTLGQTYSVSTPYRSPVGSYDPPPGSTVYNTYDPLGRLKLQTQPDGVSQLHWNYAGNATTFTDEAGNNWQRTVDSLGRLINVLEPGSLSTTYTYDVTGLRTVNQPGVSGETARNRSFSYDSLGRLVTASNPEAGVICYGTTGGAIPTSTNCTEGYDQNGNLQAKTDGRGILTSYQYDTSNRLYQKSYSDGTPASYYTYDNFTGWGQSHGASIGRLVRQYSTSASGTEDDLFSYDSMGRINHIEGATPSEAGHSSHWIQMQYDLAGNMTDMLYPSGRVIHQTFDGAGRLASVYYASQSTPYGSFTGGTTINSPYISSIGYSPNGVPQTISYGNGASEQISQNTRLQTCESKAFISPSLGGQMIVDRQYFFNSATGSPCGSVGSNNGNIWNVSDAVNTTAGSGSYSQSFSYTDGLNRINTWNTSMMAGTSRSQTFIYDSFGNPKQVIGTNMPSSTTDYSSNNNHMGTSAFGCNPSPNAEEVDSTNPGYDLAGNVLCSGVNNLNAQAYVYDGESRIYQLQKQNFSNTYSATASYSYDAGGNRIRKDSGSFNSSQYTEYIWVNGQVLTQKDQTGTSKDYIYANGKKVAAVSSVDTRFHISGVYNPSSDTGRQTLGAPPTPTNYTIQTGDTLNYRTYQHNAVARISMGFTDGSNSDWYCGQCVTPVSPADQWVTESIPLNGPMVGKTVSYWLMGNYPGGGNGQFDDMIADMAVMHADGTVTPFPTSIGALPWGGDTTDVTGVSFVGEQVGATSGQVGAMEQTRYFLSDHLGTTQMELASGGWPIWKGEFSPFGQELDSQTTANSFKFTGKERDSESGDANGMNGLDNFGARYYASTVGRFLSPDPIKISDAMIADPQQWNLYSYARNNPLKLLDPTGAYVINCLQDYDTCDIFGAIFEAQRQRDLKSKNAVVRRAAGAFGDLGDKNGVSVQFGDSAWFKLHGYDATGTGAVTDQSDSGHGLVNITVTFNTDAFGAHMDPNNPSKSDWSDGLDFLKSNIAHEGTHVADDLNFLQSYNPATNRYDGNLNLTHGQTEWRAFRSGSAACPGCSHIPHGDFEIRNVLDRNYKNDLNKPVFSNNQMTPQ